MREVPQILFMLSCKFTLPSHTVVDCLEKKIQIIGKKKKKDYHLLVTLMVAAYLPACLSASDGIYGFMLDYLKDLEISNQKYFDCQLYFLRCYKKALS